MSKTKIFLLICLFALISPTSFGQQKKVPESVLNHFKTTYPNARAINWDAKKDGTYEAEFKDNGNNMEAYYNAENSWMRTERDITRAQLPDVVWDAFSKSAYAGWKTDDFEEHETPQHKIIYQIEVEKGAQEMHLNFLPDGKLIDNKVPAK